MKTDKLINCAATFILEATGERRPVTVALPIDAMRMLPTLEATAINPQARRPPPPGAYR